MLALGCLFFIYLGKFNWVNFDSWSHGWGEDNAS